MSSDANPTENSGALFDLTVVDLGHYIAGPYCASLLAGLGADVVKVEKPEVGDRARRMGPFPNDKPHPERSGLFSYLNMGKKSVTIDLKTEKGKEALLRLVASADVLIENFAPRVMPSLGLDFDVLHQTNPRLVMTSISSFGQTGPYRDHRAFELQVSALSGVQHEIGEPDAPPLKLGGYQLQFQAGLAAAIASMSAVYWAGCSGRGQHLDVAITEVAATMKGAPVAFFQYSGVRRTRNGARPMNDVPPQSNDPNPNPRDPGMYPIAILPCKDGYVCVDPENPQQWLYLCDMIGKPELKTDPRFAWHMRGPNADLVDAVLVEYLKDKTRKELFEEATMWRVPFGIVNDMGSLFLDPQHRERGFFRKAGHPELGEIEYPGHPFLMSETPWQTAGKAPALGQDNEDVLEKKLGFTAEEVKAMQSRGGL